MDKNKGIFFYDDLILKWPNLEDMRILVGDIGGTKTLLAVFSGSGKNWTLERQNRYVSREHGSLEEIIALFLEGEKEVFSSACFGIAGPVKEGESHTTNLPWVVESKKIEEKFRIKTVFLINDLKANAYGIQTLSEKDFFVLNKARSLEGENQALISAGTGLGEAPIICYKGELIPSASEGGHADFSPRDDLEIELFKHLQAKYGHVSYERVLSGMGIGNLYEFLIASGREKRSKAVEEAMKEENSGKVICEFGLQKKDPACERTLEWFCSLYGGEAGNLALRTMATGGIYIGGGIAPKILPALKSGAFLRAFIDKGRFSTLLQQIPIKVVLDEKTALKGAAFFCEKMEMKKKS